VYLLTITWIFLHQRKNFLHTIESGAAGDCESLALHGHLWLSAAPLQCTGCQYKPFQLCVGQSAIQKFVSYVLYNLSFLFIHTMPLSS